MCEISSNVLKNCLPSAPSTIGYFWLVALADDYSYALVTNKLRSSLFVLSRSKTFDDATFASLIKRASEIGVDVSKDKKTKQN